MKRSLLVIALVFTTFMTFAQSPTGPVSSAKTDVQVAAAVEKLRLAMISGVQQDLESVLSKDLAYGHSSGKIETQAEFVGAIVSRKSDFKSIDIQDQQITVQGDLAVVRHLLNAETNDGGKKANIRLGIVLVWKKVNGEWLLCSRNAFRVAA
jgi:ketosteroid isomerase-like protein